MKKFTFRFTVELGPGRIIKGTYTVISDNHITAENDLREYLKYGLGEVYIEVELEDEQREGI